MEASEVVTTVTLPASLQAVYDATFGDRARLMEQTHAECLKATDLTASEWLSVPNETYQLRTTTFNMQEPSSLLSSVLGGFGSMVATKTGEGNQSEAIMSTVHVVETSSRCLSPYVYMPVNSNPMKRRRRYFIVTTRRTTSGVPFADYFSVETTVAAKFADRMRTKVTVSYRVDFAKFTLYKGLIAHRIRNELKAYFAAWQKRVVDTINAIPVAQRSDISSENPVRAQFSYLHDVQFATETQNSSAVGLGTLLTMPRRPPRLLVNSLDFSTLRSGSPGLTAASSVAGSPRSTSPNSNSFISSWWSLPSAVYDWFAQLPSAVAPATAMIQRTLSTSALHSISSLSVSPKAAAAVALSAGSSLSPSPAISISAAKGSSSFSGALLQWSFVELKLLGDAHMATRWTTATTACAAVAIAVWLVQSYASDLFYY